MTTQGLPDRAARQPQPVAAGAVTRGRPGAGSGLPQVTLPSAVSMGSARSARAVTAGRATDSMMPVTVTPESFSSPPRTAQRVKPQTPDQPGGLPHVRSTRGRAAAGPPRRGRGAQHERQERARAELAQVRRELAPDHLPGLPVPIWATNSPDMGPLVGWAVVVPRGQRDHRDRAERDAAPTPARVSRTRARSSTQQRRRHQGQATAQVRAQPRRGVDEGRGRRISPPRPLAGPRPPQRPPGTAKARPPVSAAAASTPNAVLPAP